MVLHLTTSLVVGSWWLAVGGRWLEVGGCWLVGGGWWLLVGGWWFDSPGLSSLLRRAKRAAKRTLCNFKPKESRGDVISKGRTEPLLR